jgi:F-type H+-transporting ATPase subunit beta
MLGMEQLSLEDRNAVARARRLERFLTQPFFTTEQFSGMKGKLVSLKDSLDGCERILRDEFKDYPESALYMIGAIEEAKKPEAKQPDVKKPGAKQPEAKQPETKKPNEEKPEDKKTDPQPKAANASTHDS